MCARSLLESNLYRSLSARLQVEFAASCATACSSVVAPIEMRRHNACVVVAVMFAQSVTAAGMPVRCCRRPPPWPAVGSPVQRATPWLHAVKQAAYTCV